MKTWTKTDGDHAAPSGKDHPLVCGHPWPVEGVFVDGSWWTPERYQLFVKWHIACLDALRDFVYGPERHRKTLEARLRASEACRIARLHGKVAPMEIVDHAKRIVADQVINAQQSEQIEAKVSHCESCRQALIKQSGHYGPDDLLRWVTGSVKLMRRLASAGFVPHAPQGTLP